MPLPADRFTLDQLDAYLEALWEGRESPLPEGLPRIAADGEGELVDWVHTRLRSISREPKDVFTREVGGLLEEFRSRICPWNAAAIRLFQEVVPFVATGPRRHEDWAYDILAVLHHSVRDPRGWVRLDYAPAGTGGDTVPCYPFDPPPAPEFGNRLHPLVAEAAIAAVAIMAEEWGYEPALVRSARTGMPSWRMPGPCSTGTGRQRVTGPMRQSPHPTLPRTSLRQVWRAPTPIPSIPPSTSTASTSSRIWV